MKDAILSFYRWLTFRVSSKHAIMYNLKSTANDRTTPLAGVKFWIEFIRAVLGIDRSTEIVCSVDGCVDCNGRASLATDGGHVMLQSGPGDCCTGYAAYQTDNNVTTCKEQAMIVCMAERPNQYHCCH